MASEIDEDEDYDHVSNFDMSASESEDEFLQDQISSTPITAPQTPRTLRPSELKTMPCPYEGCPKTFNRKARLNEHLRSHTNTRLFKCPHSPCTKDFLRESHLKHHVKSAHSNVRDYKCSWEGCGKSFATGTRLRRHEAAHEGKEKYRCRGYEGCDATFRKHDTLKRHIMTVHEQMRAFPCPDNNPKTGEPCDKSFDTAEKLRAHQRTKHDLTKFACTECLERQRAAVTDNKEWKEAETHMAYFATYADLQSHIANVHPPTCPYCPSLLTTSKELTRHLELQHGVVNPENSSSLPQFQCSSPDCGRSFTKRGNLSVHMRTVHQKRRDFVCGQTEVTLSENISSNAQLHGCGRDFTSKASLVEHIRTAHLGLGSRRAERQKKRKAEKEEVEEMFLKKRKPRKDKGVRKISALTSLIGSAPAHVHYEPAVAENYANGHATMGFPANFGSLPESTSCSSSQYLSGSMTMYGSQLFHRDSGHQSTLNLQHTSFTARSGIQDDHDMYEHSGGGDADDDDDFLFGGFEHEKLSFVDPSLLRQ